jgi:hypothetical protein
MATEESENINFRIVENEDLSTIVALEQGKYLSIECRTPKLKTAPI